MRGESWGEEWPRRDLPDTEITSSVSTVLTVQLLLGTTWTQNEGP